jgi:hypothetical protein
MLAWLAALWVPPTVLANPYLEDPNREFRYDDSRDVPWIEQDTNIPALPDPDDLQNLRIEGLPPGFELYLDTTGLTVDAKDGVIRLWLFLRSDRGTNNGTFEGFRCASGEYRVYGYATPRREPPVTRANRSTWRGVKDSRGDRYRRALMESYLCDLRGAREPSDIHQAVRAGNPRDSLLER